MKDKDIDLGFGGFDPNLSPGPAALKHILEHVEVLQGRLNSVTAKLGTLQQQDAVLREGLQRVSKQIEHARRLQQDLLPATLPRCAGIKISSLYLPASELSGDMYDVLRLSDHQVALNISDATGHGMAAAILNAVMRQCIKAPQLNGDGGGPCSPQRVLHRLNRELIQLNLTDCDFLTTIYGVYDESDGVLTWSRGGMPYPILIRPGCRPEALVSQGGLIGVFENQEYAGCRTRLDPGDILLWYTDGLEALLLHHGDHPPAGGLADSEWCRTLSPETVADHLRHVDQAARDTDRARWPVDDITMLVVEGT